MELSLRLWFSRFKKDPVLERVLKRVARLIDNYSCQYGDKRQLYKRYWVHLKLSYKDLQIDDLDLESEANLLAKVVKALRRKGHESYILKVEGKEPLLVVVAKTSLWKERKK